MDRGSFREYDMLVEHACQDFGMDKVENKVKIISILDLFENSWKTTILSLILIFSVTKYYIIPKG